MRQTAMVKAEAVEGVFTVTSQLRLARKAAQPAGSHLDPALDCCEVSSPEIEKPGSIGDRAFPNPEVKSKPY